MAKTPKKPSRRVPVEQGPRVNLTLTPELDASVGRLAELSGVGKATWIRMWLETIQPQFPGMILALEQLHAGNLDAFTTMQKTLRSAVGQGEQTQLELGRMKRAVRRKVARG